MTDTTATPPRIQAAKICKILGEPVGGNQERQIAHHIRIYGIEKVKDLLRKAKKKQDNGGMWTHDRSRKRTFGGIYFELARSHGYNEYHRKKQAEAASEDQP